MRVLGSSLVMVALMVGTASCAATAARNGGEPDVVTREEMFEVNAQNAYDAVQKLEPGWLTSRGPISPLSDTGETYASVYMTGSHMGDVEFLRSLRPEQVDRLVYFDTGEASARFGMGHPRGVIEVIPR